MKFFFLIVELLYNISIQNHDFIFEIELNESLLRRFYYSDY